MSNKSVRFVPYFSFGEFIYKSYVTVFKKENALQNWKQKAICRGAFALNKEKANFHPFCLNNFYLELVCKQKVKDKEDSKWLHVNSKR